MEDEILKKKTVINGILYTPTVVPDVLKDHWKGMKKTI